MTRQIFVNLPVTDLPRARAFYQALGFTIDDQFSGDSGACVVISDAISVMILTHGQFRDLSPRPLVDPRQGATALISLTCDSRTEVDALCEAAKAAGGADAHPPEDLGFMYSRAFHDPDGNAFGLFWINPEPAGG